MPKYCDKLGYSDTLKEQAQNVIEKIHSEGWIEGCQPLTEIGVALYTLNTRLEEIHKKSQMKGYNFDQRVLDLL